MPLHLGPLGALHTMRGPAPGLPVEHPRHGGTHTALSGASVVDYLGSGGTFEFTWRHLTEVDAAYLEAIRDRHVPGPLRFVLDGWKRNRLSRSAACLGFGGRDPAGVEFTSGYTEPANIWPPAAPPAGLARKWVNYTAGTAVRLDRARPVPVLAGETGLTSSLYVWASHSDTVRLDVEHYTASGWTGATIGSSVTLTAGAWQRLATTVTPPAGVWGLSPALTSVTRAAADSALTVAAAQVEPGDTATTWAPGGGAPRVAVDALPLSLPRAGYVDPELTLVEV